MNGDINFFAETNFRHQQKKFGIKLDDRRRHFYVIGKTGMGKTVLLKNKAVQDILAGYGMGFVDPHGEAAEELLDFIPSSRINDVIYFNPADLDHPIAFNIMEQVRPEYRHLVAGGLMGVFKKIWPDVWSARMEYILNNCILALLEYPGATLLGVNRMLADVEYRKEVVSKVTDPVIKAFWTQEFARYTQRYEVEATAAIQNKVGQFISAPIIRNIIGQTHSSIDMREVMDSRKILIMNLSKGRIGEDNSRLLGALMITKLQLAAMSRVDTPEEERQDFFLYIDEFQNFATQSFTNILSEARKYRLALVLGHQYITQMEEEVRDAVFGNVGTMVVFRVGAEDAEFLEREFTPEFMASDLVNLTKYHIYLKLMIDGVAGRPFSAVTLPPWPNPEGTSRDKIIKASRERYGTARSEVEDKIARWTEMSELPVTAQFPQQQQKPLYDARCSACGRDTKVVFPPDGVRPVYCKACRKKIESERYRGGSDSQGEGFREPSQTRREPRQTRREPSQTRREERDWRQDKGPEERNFPRDSREPSREESEPRTLSLKDLPRGEPMPFSPPRRDRPEQEKHKRKEVDLGGLREILKSTNNQRPTTNNFQPATRPDDNNKQEDNNILNVGDKKNGFMKPGETVRL